MNDERQYTIKITGGGSFREIKKALQGIINRLNTIEDSDYDIEWEDDMLMTEIKEDEPKESGPFDQLGYEQTKEE